MRGLTDTMMAYLVAHSPTLHNLCMFRCFRLTDAAFVAIANGCTMLHSLDMRYCGQDTITDAAFVALATRPDITT